MVHMHLCAFVQVWGESHIDQRCIQCHSFILTFSTLEGIITPPYWVLNILKVSGSWKFYQTKPQPTFPSWPQMGPTWAAIWGPHGQPIWAPPGFVRWACHGPIWASPLGAKEGPIWGPSGFITKLYGYFIFCFFLLLWIW
jgi:hypothetical protein